MFAIAASHHMPRSTLRASGRPLFCEPSYPDTGGAVSEELAAGLPLAVKAPHRSLTSSSAFFSICFSILHGLRGRRCCPQIGGTPCRGPVRRTPVASLPFQCELVFDAGDADAEVWLQPWGRASNGQIYAVEAGQLLVIWVASGQSVQARSITSGSSAWAVACRLAAGREREVDADAAAVEFLRGVIREVDAGRDLESSQCSIVLLYYFVCSSARYSSSERPEARMARALSLPTYRQCHGSNTMPVAA